jgi:hypothetical protein
VPFRSFWCPNFKTEVIIRKQIPEETHRRIMRSRGVPRKSEDLGT